jgi:hypothetical protein
VVRLERYYAIPILTDIPPAKSFKDLIDIIKSLLGSHRDVMIGEKADIPPNDRAVIWI